MVGVMVVVIIGVRKGVRVGVKERFASGSVFRTFFKGVCVSHRGLGSGSVAKRGLVS